VSTTCLKAACVLDDGTMGQSDHGTIGSWDNGHGDNRTMGQWTI
jgi:hypothetical protein